MQLRILNGNIKLFSINLLDYKYLRAQNRPIGKVLCDKFEISKINL
jgi:hypothetical protein